MRPLTNSECRVLGCLIEKELATPEYYPLSLNALTNACNQRSNREPVLALEETEVVRALDALRQLGLARQSAEGVRAAKYCHCLAERYRLDRPELALLAELLLRGPQTVGELRTRGERMCPFPGLDAVEEGLQELQKREPPLVMRLPRQPGHKECRHAHLLAGEPAAETIGGEPPLEAARRQVQAEDDRLAKLEAEVATLRAKVDELQLQLSAFQSQFT